MAFFEINKNANKRLPVILNTLSDRFRQNEVNRPEGYEYAQILWVVEGCGTYEVGGERFVLSCGEGIWMRAGVPHRYSGDHFYTAWCAFTVADSFFDQLGLGDYLRFRVPPFLNRETRQLLEFATGNSTVLERSAACYSYVTEIFSYLLAQKESLSDKVLHLLEQRYAEPLTLGEISDLLRVDRFHLCHTYKAEKGRTVMEDLYQIRIKKAKQYLKYDTASVEEIGRLCGFESPSYFSKRFRQTVGCTPTEYRKKNR